MTYEDQGDGSAVELRLEFQYNAQSLTRYIADPSANNTFSNGVWTMDGASPGDVDQVTEYVFANLVDGSWATEVRYPDPSSSTDGAVGTTAADKVVLAYNRDGATATVTDQAGTVHALEYDSLRRPTGDLVTTLGSGVDGAVRARKLAYNTRGQISTATAFNSSTSFASGNVVNEIKHTYDAFGALTKVEFDHDSLIGDNTGVDTRAVEYAYEKAFNSGTMKFRPQNLKYPDARYVWYDYGYSAPSGTSWDQSAFNDAFSRASQIKEGTSGSSGNILFQYTYNGLNRMVRRESRGTTGGWNGGKTRLEYWGGTAAEYRGFDRFGRIVDHSIEKTGDGTRILQRKYTYDRASNRTDIVDPFSTLDSAEYSYDDRHRLTDEDRGWYNVSTSALELNTLLRDFVLNKVGAMDSEKVNATTETQKYGTNSTNEVTDIEHNNNPGHDLAVKDDFGSTLSSAWSPLTNRGSFSTSSGELQVDSLGAIGVATLGFDANANVGDATFQVKVKPSSANQPCGIFIAGAYAAVINPSTDVFGIAPVSAGGGIITSPVTSVSTTIASSTYYTITVVKRQQTITAWLDNDPTTVLTYSSSYISAFGRFGVITMDSGTKFDEYRVYHAMPFERAGLQYLASADFSQASGGSGELTVNGKHHGGEVIFAGHADADYIAQVKIDLNGGLDGALYFRYIDPDNWYRVRLEDTKVYFDKMLHGILSAAVASGGSYSGSGYHTVKVKCVGSSIDIWVDGVDQFSTLTDGDLSWGEVGVSGWQAKFDDLKVGYDNNADDDIDDGGDDVVLDVPFTNVAASPTYDNPGNLTQDEDYTYVYDAWQNVVKVKSAGDADVVVAAYTFFADNRLAKKVVAQRGDLTGATYYLYDGQEVIEERNGSEAIVQQYVYGPRHIDELLMIRGENGAHWAHQDANWNVMALTNPNGKLAEEYHYDPYGRQVARRYTAFGDGDQDGDVDEDDLTKGWEETQSPHNTYDRLYDADLDGDNDSYDDNAFNKNYLAAGTSVVVPNRRFSPSENWTGFTGRLHEPESGLMHYRHRSYHPGLRRFAQGDPLGYVDGANRYAYVLANPLLLVDPLGCGARNSHVSCTMCHNPEVLLGPNYDPVGAAAERAMVAGGFGKMIGGAIEVAAGVVTMVATIPETGAVGAAAGAFVVSHGSDLAQAGWEQANAPRRENENGIPAVPVNSMMSTHLSSAMGKPEAAAEVDVLLSVVGAAATLGAGALTSATVASGEAAGSGINGFVQRWYRERFTEAGRAFFLEKFGIKVETIDDLVNAVRAGTISANDIPIGFIMSAEGAVILNTRSAMALMRYGTPIEEWNMIDQSLDLSAYMRYFEQIRRNDLPFTGFRSIPHSGPLNECRFPAGVP